jgi:hypothetical protein
MTIPCEGHITTGFHAAERQEVCKLAEAFHTGRSAVGPVPKITTLHLADWIEEKRLRGSDQLGWSRGMHIAPSYPSMDVASNSVQGLSRR